MSIFTAAAARLISAFHWKSSKKNMEDKLKGHKKPQARFGVKISKTQKTAQSQFPSQNAHISRHTADFLIFLAFLKLFQKNSCRSDLTVPVRIVFDVDNWLKEGYSADPNDEGGLVIADNALTGAM